MTSEDYQKRLSQVSSYIERYPHDPGIEITTELMPVLLDERNALQMQLADANRQISQLKTAAVQVDAALGKLKERDDYVEKRILANFYGEVCDEADRIIEQTNMVSGAHWNAMKRVLARKGMKVDAEVAR